MTLVNRFFSYVNQQPKVRRQCFGLFLTRFFPHDTTIHMYIYIYPYTGWLVTGGKSGKGVILREERSRKCRIKILLPYTIYPIIIIQ